MIESLTRKQLVDRYGSVEGAIQALRNRGMTDANIRRQLGAKYWPVSKEIDMLGGLEDIGQDNRLVIVRRYPGIRRYVIQGKRVGKNCPVTQEEVAAYVKGGAPAILKMIQARMDCTLAEALKILQHAKKGNW
jgi:hypothetical protein